MSAVPCLIHHAASLGHQHPPSSLSGLRACVAAGARLVEVDITPLADGDFALLHDDRLAEGTDGTGSALALSGERVRALHLVQSGRPTGEPVALLSQALELAGSSPRLDKLQLDLKAHVPLTDRILAGLGERAAPLLARVRVSTVADWALRRLAQLAPGLALGFDPLLYLDLEDDDAVAHGVPPLRMGAYGYRDDHPLALARWGAPRDYLEARAEVLHAQAPNAGVWYIRAQLLARALDEGFDWIAYLHGRGVQVAAWTLDADRHGGAGLARRLARAGVDRITTNDAAALARALAMAE